MYIATAHQLVCASNQMLHFTTDRQHNASFFVMEPVLRQIGSAISFS